jgi:hypothetical protein
MKAGDIENWPNYSPKSREMVVPGGKVRPSAQGEGENHRHRQIIFHHFPLEFLQDVGGLFKLPFIIRWKMH